MDRRLKLHNLLKEVSGLENVYFQPPENLKMKYPCIVYRWGMNHTQYADDNPYIKNKRYNVQVLDRNPDSEIPDKISTIKTCIFDVRYAQDDVYHTSFNLYF